MSKTKVVDGLELVFKLPSEAYKDNEPIEPTELYAITAFKK